jgi:hypothetical protein
VRSLEGSRLISWAARNFLEDLQSADLGIKEYDTFLMREVSFFRGGRRRLNGPDRSEGSRNLML